MSLVSPECRINPLVLKQLFNMVMQEDSTDELINKINEIGGLEITAARNKLG